MKKRVVLIGAGRRMKEGIIPALDCLRDYFDITAICSRSKKTLSLFDGRFSMKTTDSFADIDFSQVDLIIVAVSIREVADVLKKLVSCGATRCDLFLDTPVLYHTDLGAVSYIKKFKRAWATEESMLLPPFIVAHDLIKKGKIGKLKHIYLWHNGYRYHALSLLKSLFGVTGIASMKQTKWTEECRKTEISFKGGGTAEIIDPRDYGSGRFMIVGDKGCIVDYPLTCASENIHTIGYKENDGRYFGLELDGKAVADDALDKLYKKHLSTDLYKKSLNNSMKIRGLMTLFMSYYDGKTKDLYRIEDGLYDILSIMITEKFGRFRDLPRKRGKGAFHAVISMVSKVMRTR